MVGILTITFSLDSSNKSVCALAQQCVIYRNDTAHWEENICHHDAITFLTSIVTIDKYLPTVVIQCIKVSHCYENALTCLSGCGHPEQLTLISNYVT